MKLTNFTDYSLRVLIFLATEPARRATIAEVAKVFDISENHLVKVVHFLGKQGWIETVRGRGGGIVLARPADQISIGKVVRDTESIAMPAECFSDGSRDCMLNKVCRLKGVLGEAMKAFYAALDRYSLADITANQQTLAKVLKFYPR